LFARHERAITMFSQGVNQSSAGTDKANSIINCHLLTGRIGRAGMGPFSITGQPNAMGGREVGGMANMLAAHMDLENASHRHTVQQFWRSPTIANRAGLKAVDLFEAIHAGKVKAVWIMATNPVVSLPDADRVREALRRCELVVVSDCIAATDTNAFAHVLLPAAGWGEKDGTVTNSERRISRQRAFLSLPGDAQPDWWIVTQVARRMGYREAFGYESAHEIFIEHAALSGEDAAGHRSFDISALASMDRNTYDDLPPVRWPAPRSGPSGDAFTVADRFYHADGRARFVSTEPKSPAHRTSDEFPLVLNTGRIRDQWHTMTRSARSPRLSSHITEAYVDLHRDDAERYGLREGLLAKVATRWGSIVVRVRCSGEMRRGALFVPIHWSDRFCSQGRVGALVNPVVDPISGEPEFKHTPARVEPFAASWYGFALTRSAIDTSLLDWWSQSSGSDFIRTELAGQQPLVDIHQWTVRLLGKGDEHVEYRDDSTGMYRTAVIAQGRLQSVLFIARDANLPDRGWLASLFRKKTLSLADRA
jgi:assimilatory nitrate reductase catalytic subunit